MSPKGRESPEEQHSSLLCQPVDGGVLLHSQHRNRKQDSPQIYADARGFTHRSPKRRGGIIELNHTKVVGGAQFLGTW
jgi:hypothetical protein